MEISATDLPTCRALLRAAVPDLDIRGMRYLAEGWDNVLFLVNDDLVVRFARRDATARPLITEAALLRATATALPVPIPAPEFVVEVPVAFVGYRWIAGMPLDSVALDAPLAAALAPSLTETLNALHTIPVELVAPLGIPRYTPATWLAHENELYRRTRADLRNALDPAPFRRFDSWWNRYRADPASATFQPCLVHGDLVIEHVLVARDPWRVSGLIDFGDAMIADPALDVAGLPDALARATMKGLRSVSNPDAWWRRRNAYRKIAPLHAIAAGRERDDPTLLRQGIERIRRELRRS